MINPTTALLVSPSYRESHPFVDRYTRWLFACNALESSVWIGPVAIALSQVSASANTHDFYCGECGDGGPYRNVAGAAAPNLRKITCSCG